MPRNGRIIWLAATLGLIGSLRAQDDLPPPPKTVVKSAPAPLPPDDLDAPPAPKKKPTAKAETSKPPKDSIDFPGVELPGDPPAANVKSPPSTMELPGEPKRGSSSQKSIQPPPSTLDLPSEPTRAVETPKPRQMKVPPVDSIAIPDVDAKAPTAATASSKDRKLSIAEPIPAPAPPTVSKEPGALPITLSAPVTAQSTRSRKAAALQPVETPMTQPTTEKAIPAPSFPKKMEIIASSLTPEERRAQRKTFEAEKAKPEEKTEKEPVIQAAAVEPAPKPQDKYELVQPRMPHYDVVHSKSSPRRDADALRTVYESPEQLLQSGIVQTAALAEGQGPQIESYQVRIWKIDGWETFQELARMEYRDESLAASLAKYNRSGYRPADPIPAGQKIRLPPKWVLERSATTVARRPAPIKSDFQAPPATAVQGQPAGSGVVASSGDRSKPGSLVRENAASPIPKEKPPVEAGPVFVVNEAGMTLYKVAKRALGEGSQWKQIYDLNRDRLSSSQSELKIGTRLRLPEGSMIR